MVRILVQARSGVFAKNLDREMDHLKGALATSNLLMIYTNKEFTVYYHEKR